MDTRKRRTITLTDRAPVKIVEEDWPVIAVGSYDDHDGQVRCQANRTWRGSIRVRQHDDGRAIVYGMYDYDSNFQSERGITTRAGVLLASGAEAAAIPEAINSVRDTLQDSLTEAGFDYGDHVSACALDCLAHLPPEEI